MKRKELIDKGYSFKTIDNKSYLDMTSNEKMDFSSMKHELRMVTNTSRMFLNISQKRGKALDILLPLIDQDRISDSLAELYDKRDKEKALIAKIVILQETIVDLKKPKED